MLLTKYPLNVLASRVPVHTTLGDVTATEPLVLVAVQVFAAGSYTPPVSVVPVFPGLPAHTTALLPVHTIPCAVRALGAPVVLVADHVAAVGVVAVGVPEITPVVGFSVKPAGSVCPGASDHVSAPPLPPDAVSVVEYAVPVFPAGRELPLGAEMLIAG
jgi:hypothetical protein